jgi:hypothetical protein
MKRLTPADYRTDSLFPRVARAVDDLLQSASPVSIPSVFVKMGMLSGEQLRAWRSGQVPYLERVIAGNLGKASRVVRIVSFYAHDLKLPLAPPHAAGSIKLKGRPLRFSKTGDRRLEDAYRRVFAPRPSHWKQIPTPDIPASGIARPAVEQGIGPDGHAPR